MDFTPSLYKLSPPLGPRPEGRCKERLRLLGRVEDILRRVVVGSEGRMWLISALSALAVPSTVQAPLFLDLVRHAVPSSSSRSNRDMANGKHVAKQVARMLCGSRPQQVADLLINDSSMLCRFFSGQSHRVLQWFQNFAGVGEMGHQLGARALAQYAFMNRESSWHELVWKGSRSQAPATVASKPHYFSELDVIETIDNFLEKVPSFWYSDELRDTLKDGQFLSLDIDFFVDELLARMADNDFSSVWQLVKMYLAEESFTVLCQRILPIVSDINLIEFINGLGADIYKRKEIRAGDLKKSEQSLSKNLGSSCNETSWLEVVLPAGVEWEMLSDVIVCNACARHGRDLFRLLQDEEHQEEARLLDPVLSDANGYDEKEHWELRGECLLARSDTAVKWLCVEAWLLFNLLSQGKVSQVTLEGLMTDNGIGFLRAGTTSVEENELGSQGSDTETAREKRGPKKRRRKKLKGRSRKKHNYSEEDSESDSRDRLIKVEELSWRLSIDDYLITWTKGKETSLEETLDMIG